MILGVAVYLIAVQAGWPNPQAWIFFPLVVRAFGLLATIVSVAFFIRGREDENPMNILNRGYWVDDPAVSGRPRVRDRGDDADRHRCQPSGLPVWVWFFFAGLVGLATSVVFVYITQYYTAGTFRPVREIAEASQDRSRDQHHRGHRGRLRDHLRRRRSPSPSPSSPATGSASRPVSSTRPGTTSAASSARRWPRWACS